MKIFTNGKFQMTGLKTDTEAVNITNRIISILKNVTLKIFTSKKQLENYFNSFEKNNNTLDSSYVKTNNQDKSSSIDDNSIKNNVTMDNRTDAYGDGYQIKSLSLEQKTIKKSQIVIVMKIV